MIRPSKHSLKFSNKNKLELLDQTLELCKKCLQNNIDKIWYSELPLKNFVSSKDLPNDFISNSTYKNQIYQQAVSIIRANKKQKKKSKPEIKNCSINLDYHLFDIEEDKTSFDQYIRIKLPFRQENSRYCQTIKCPIKLHKQSKKYKDWTRKDTVQINKINDQYYVTFFYEKDEPEKLPETNIVGVDVGYKKLLATSTGNIYGQELESLYCKSANKKHGSKNHKKSITHKNNKTNQVINEFLDQEKPSTIIIEDLKYVKHNTKKNNTISTKTMNKLQYWVYSRVINRLQLIAEERGINIVKVSPAYTSQQCSSCGAIDKNSRNGEKFKCVACGYEIDADLNAAINIHNKGVIDPLPLKGNY